MGTRAMRAFALLGAVLGCTDPPVTSSPRDVPEPPGAPEPQPTPEPPSFREDNSLNKAHVPNRAYDDAELDRFISPDMGRGRDHTQPHMHNGYALLSGNASHQFWDISDPYAPAFVSQLDSPHGEGEAESHQMAFARYPGDRYYLATTSGRGIDIWDITDVAQPKLLKSLELDGIDYGDFVDAVWGVAWQGGLLYVGATNHGLKIVDVSEPAEVSVIRTIENRSFGNINAGPIFAMGNLLLVMTSKESAGLATMDISDPLNPTLLDFWAGVEDSYIGGFYGAHAFLNHPIRVFDVTSDPQNIQLLHTVDNPGPSYFSFTDGLAFVGHPGEGGIEIYDVDQVQNIRLLRHLRGRETTGTQFSIFGLNDEFSYPVGNLLIVSDDEIGIGSALAVYQTEPDRKGPSVLYTNPGDGSKNLSLKTQVGLSFSDQIDLTTINETTLIVRAVGGEAPLLGKWGLYQTLASFSPDEPLQPDTDYEVLIPAGGIKDVVGNPMAEDFRFFFSTGTGRGVPECDFVDLAPAPVGQVRLTARRGTAQTEYAWDLGDGQTSDFSLEPCVLHTYGAPGRYALKLTARLGDSERSCSAVQVVHRDLPRRSPVLPLPSPPLGKGFGR